MAGNSGSSPSPSKLLKSQTLALPLSSTFFSKGKDKLQEPKDDPLKEEEEEVEEEERGEELMRCGVCLSEEGKTIRGWIDSCDHYFCFVCIMEWAKVESRCPMCKRRFSSIRRPPKEGVFACERIVDVPVRDQVFHPLGNTTIGPFDLYAQVQCSVCHGMADESLLLLCDLCDSAAHTYCVGLGATVPEGDWFCHDCSASRAEHANGDTNTDCNNQYDLRINSVRRSAGSHVSVFDIVRESNIPEIEESHLVSSQANQASSPMVPSTGIRVANNVSEVATNTSGDDVDKTAESGARTLHRCRNVHNHIRTLRENWNALRSGSLSFSSRLIDSDGRSSQKRNVRDGPSNRSGKAHLSSTSCPQLTAQDDFPSRSSNSRGSSNVDKAWKMMHRSMIQAYERPTISQGASNESKQLFCNRTVQRKLTSSNATLPASKSLTFERGLGSIRSKRHNNHDVHEKMSKKQRPQKFGNLTDSRVITKEISKFNEVSTDACMPRYFELASSMKHKTLDHVGVCRESGENLLRKNLHEALPSSIKAQTSVEVDICDKNGGKFLQNNLCETSSNVVKEHPGQSCLFSPVGPVLGTSEFSHSNPDLSTSASCEVGFSRGQGVVERRAKSKPSKGDDAKSEIRSLVKLNLKLLNREKSLGADAFKEVARRATHTILAACGLEHRKSGVYFPTSVCRHAEQIQRLQKSTLMPTSCRECFYAFVKDVVNSVMLEKVGLS
ncbi:uncharacterized protein LOC131146661 [Malania oleifera]|uniref:uncharacterized protein LOC131146661 n=1 Tax=Malania oleifera TaxID=397392 RepID=UPI0025AE4440|nr:uncharacterized protein LOC131146661 [Malania oleifera]